MSQLRKSASFRSRIPVRRTRLPQRRCCSPLGTSTNSNLSSSRSKRLNAKRSATKQSATVQAGTVGTGPNTQQRFDKSAGGRRYSSSSFSSSDESCCESEAPLQVRDNFLIESIFCHSLFETCPPPPLLFPLPLPTRT